MAMIVCNVLIFLGCLIKVFSVASVSFGVLFSGQVLIALAQVIILNVPTQLAQEWFPAPEKTTS